MDQKAADGSRTIERGITIMSNLLKKILTALMLAAMVALILIFYTGNGVFVYEGV